MRMPPFCSRAMATASQPASPKPLYSRLTSKSDALSAKARPSARADSSRSAFQERSSFVRDTLTPSADARASPPVT